MSKARVINMVIPLVVFFLNEVSSQVLFVWLYG